MTTCIRGTLVAAVVLAISTPLVAQSPVLSRVEDLARMGRAEEARVELMEWWDGARDNSSQRDLQLGLWLRGRLTVDPAQAELDFQRLIVLYPSSPYTPQAIFRLAQSSFARGDVDAARRHVATLVRDYSSSQSRTDAQAWLAGAGPPPAPAGGGAPPTAPTVASNPAPAAADSAVTPPFRAARPPAAPLVWFVQFGAFADEDRAFALHQQLVAAGLAARLVTVEGSAFVHVRIGRFATREEASAQLDEVTNRGYSASLVRDERAETMVRR